MLESKIDLELNVPIESIFTNDCASGQGAMKMASDTDLSHSEITSFCSRH